MRRPPAGFTLLSGQDGSQLLLRAELDRMLPALEPAVLGLRLRAAPLLARSARGAVVRLELADGTTLAARAYLHGGLLGGVAGDRGMGWRRAVAEVEASDAARRRGVRTPEVVAVYFRKPGFRAPILLTRVVDGRRPADLRGAPLHERREGARAMGDCVAALFGAQVEHPDLNLSNFLVDAGPPAVASVLDLDGARVLPRLTPARKERMLRRMCRSSRKLGHGGVHLSARDALAFLRAVARRDAEVASLMPELLARLSRPFPAREAMWRLRRREPGCGAP